MIKVIFLLILILLASCESKDDEYTMPDHRLIGTWKYEETIPYNDTQKHHHKKIFDITNYGWIKYNHYRTIIHENDSLESHTSEIDRFTSLFFLIEYNKRFCASDSHPNLHSRARYCYVYSFSNNQQTLHLTYYNWFTDVEDNTELVLKKQL